MKKGKEGKGFEAFLKRTMLEKMYAHPSWVRGDGSGHCKLFTKKDRDNMRAFLNNHLN